LTVTSEIDEQGFMNGFGDVVDATKRIAKVMLSSGDIGRPFIGPPGIPADRVKILHEAQEDHEMPRRYYS
jgi:hypothetical protein